MNVIDIILIVLLTFGLIRGFIKGFIIEVASLIAIIAGIYGAIYFSHLMVGWLAGNLDWQTDNIRLLAYALTFLLIVIGILILGKLLTKFANVLALGIVNRILGGIFGVVKVALVCSTLIWFTNNWLEDDNFFTEEKQQQSVLYIPIKQIAPIVLPGIIEEVNQTTDKLFSAK
ncbi:CvpA family protein [Haloflavibacter putidus]|uniref:CvpA family protein n=1 Tax=Haloflavibacter putidus TaxID=2576776 RepID=A0A508A3V5_9FLAO|nr:CvpA family protein [Haloflavibacter putidus]TQD40542.1 CvpA family protein [Haloflavibacter putidus]